MGELPDQPTVNRAKGEFAVDRLLACSAHVIQNPFEFGAGEIGIYQQACFGLDRCRQAALAQSDAGRLSAAVLPDDRVVDRQPRLAVPNYGSFTLVSDANGNYVARLNAGFGQRLARGSELGAPDFHGAVSY